MNGQYPIKIKGKNGISAEVVKDSISPSGDRITTLNIEYGLIVHGEFLRHRLLSNSVKSNRAIPMKVLRKEVLDNPYVPVWFGAAQKGMVADSEVKSVKWARRLWLAARYPAVFFHWVAEKMGAHKEWANRLLNPWQFVRETVTGTEWDNFFALRLDKAAQKDIQELAKVMKEAMNQSTPNLLYPGEWHVPYVTTIREGDDNQLKYYDHNWNELSVDDAIKCSAARCARSSYNKHDKTNPSVAEDLMLYTQLITADLTHGSPAEHVATPIWEYAEDLWMDDNEDGSPTGITHCDKSGRLWSGNLIGWIQHRQQLRGHTVWRN